MSLEEMTKIDNLKSWTSGVEVEWEAVQQLRNIAALPILAGHVAVMPDVHLGKGATVGSVIPTKAAIIPSAVGVDIGCGMAAVRTSITANDLPDSLATLRSRIERRVPVGFSSSRRSGQPGARRVARRAARSGRQEAPRAIRSAQDPRRDPSSTIRRGPSSSSERSAAATTSSSCASMSRTPCGSCCIPDRATSARRSARRRSAWRVRLQSVRSAGSATGISRGSMRDRSSSRCTSKACAGRRTTQPTTAR